MRTLALVDGEHYPPVTIAAIAELRRRGYDVVAAVFLGGGEKIGDRFALEDLPIVRGDSQVHALQRALDEHRPAVVVDVSDAPVVDGRARGKLASLALARGASYHAAGMRLDPPPRPRLTTVPTVSVIGTGKRTGKTAVAAAFARHAAARGERPVMVAMGRGGPAAPVVLREPPTVEDLVALAERGEHAASDAYEDAVMARVPVVGARRAGAGPAGEPLVHTVAEAIAEANRLEPGLVVLEGSGTAIPPAAADATLLVAGGSIPAEETVGGLGAYRILIADLVVVTMSEEPILTSDPFSALSSLLSEFAREVPTVRTVFRPVPVEPVDGKKVLYATTAPETAGSRLRRHLEEEHGATVVGITHRLADRTALAEDLQRAEGRYDILLTELKAAAIDVAARRARAAGAAVVLADNVPVGDGLEEAFDALLARARAGR